MFTKPLSALTKADIDQVIRDAVCESAEIELKQSLPAKGGRDPWMDGADKISDRARNEIVEEVIALANAYGGTLFIGVAETPDNPPRAASIVLLPRCADLAERLHLQCRDCIEPQVPLIEIAGVPLEASGSGIVVIRVPQSRSAPHRHLVSRECYIRRGTRSEKMTMREIQDLTLVVERRLASLASQFNDRARKFEAEVTSELRNIDGVAVRATLQPTAPLHVDRRNLSSLEFPIQRMMGTIDGSEGGYQLVVPREGGTWRPILRGRRIEYSNEYGSLVREIYADGLVEYELVVKYDGHGRGHEGQGRPAVFYPGWLMGFVANSLCAAERFRRVAGAPSVEYALELELRVVGPPIGVARYGGNSYGELGPLSSGRHLFPQYSVGQIREFQSLAALIEHDFWNACGHDWKQSIKIDFEAALSS